MIMGELRAQKDSLGALQYHRHVIRSRVSQRRKFDVKEVPISHILNVVFD